MWLKPLIIFFSFYFFAILQSSFFVHLSPMLAGLNIVLIFFLLIIFFDYINSYYQIIFWAVIAGIFLDASSYSYFGTSIALFIVIGIFTKKWIQSLKIIDDKYPSAYFILAFLISYIFYNIASGIFFFSWSVARSLILNTIAASMGFYIFKHFYKIKIK